GTLSEIALALKLGRPVVALRTWPLDPGLLARTGARVHEAADASDAAQRALAFLRTAASG
ncbi:MAG: TIGR00725 family protein, partial [Thermomicrobium sp.]|nr:TIGR00725 family protein [Thermomicrobium sp.]